MVENGRRYGVLSSATRAYFLFIEGDGEKAQVRISSPWFIVVIIPHLQQSVQKTSAMSQWVAMCGQQAGGGDAPAGHAAQMSALPKIPIENVEIVGTLGYGRNGVVFLANWRGQKVALKQFDVGKDGCEYFDSEVAAYLALDSVWGSLVVTPLFVSESWSGWMKFIGLQLGRDPLPGDNVSERINVFFPLWRTNMDFVMMIMKMAT
ncbi:expressed unknown protein [Seminavis robusta]|uniref:Protein kinase domain-containing protein n=1 Tax=Seminavis robusta TaxID=568900 RepID=A0A9N8DWF4_9STRA|nr:expressed unknown protein [Seminavis robusta]|eukprot:Sro394_g133840.1 n/a (206) ;mRNA; f:34829-35546